LCRSQRACSSHNINEWDKWNVESFDREQSEFRDLHIYTGRRTMCNDRVVLCNRQYEHRTGFQLRKQSYNLRRRNCAGAANNIDKWNYWHMESVHSRQPEFNNLYFHTFRGIVRNHSIVCGNGQSKRYSRIQFWYNAYDLCGSSHTIFTDNINKWNKRNLESFCS